MPVVGSGIIGPGASEYVDFVLTAGHTYSVYVQPFEPGVDFDLSIYDENGNLIASDMPTTPDAHCAVTPRWTGPFRFVVNTARGLSSHRIEVED